MTIGAELHELRRKLLTRRNLTAADGRPLFEYRFDHAEYDELKRILRRAGPSFVDHTDGCMAFVAYAAEWFRRDREGGHWDWIRPLREIGITYGEPGARLSHGQIRDAVIKGLRHWRRPDAGAEYHAYVLAIVRECGFPAAAIRRGEYLEAWLSSALALVERGFPVDVAVAREAWRAPDQLVGVVIETAKALCNAVAGLRAKFRGSKAAELDLDPIAFLDASEPAWRDALPVIIEDDDASTLIEDLVRARKPTISPFLAIERYLEASPEGWRARANVELEGHALEEALPAGLRDTVGSHVRLQLKPRGILAETYPRAIATLERETTDEGDTTWRLFKRVSKFHPLCDLGVEIAIGAEADAALLAEFVPEGGDAVDDLAVVFRLDTDQPSTARRLVYLTSSSARVRDEWMAIGMRSDLRTQLSIDGQEYDLGRTADGSISIIAVKGKAAFRHDGDHFTWTSASENEEFERLVFDGRRMHGIHDSIFLGVPTITVAGSVTRSQKRIEDVWWRPVGRRDWRKGGTVFGHVEFADMDGDEIKARGVASIAPPKLRIEPSPKTRSLRLTGLAGASVSARYRRSEREASPLHAAHETDGVSFDLSPLGVGEIIDLELIWLETRLRLRLRDPTTPNVLITPEGRISPPRAPLCVHGLGGWRVFAASPSPLHFELPPEDGRSVGATTIVHGETPLVSYQQTIKAILASATSDDALSATARLHWSGGVDRLADVTWYPPEGSPFNGDPKGLEGIPLLHPSSVVSVGGVDAASNQRLLEALRERGGGPCLVYATDGTRTTGRPYRVTLEVADDASLSPLQCIALVDQHATRKARLAARFGELDDWSPEEFAYLRDIIVVARGRIPFASFDVLRQLTPDHEAAVRVLAVSDTLAHRDAVLSLQEELPFLWAATSTRAWVDAMRSRRDSLRASLGEGARHFATEAVAKALADTIGFDPSLSGHVAIVARALIDDEPAALAASTELISLAKKTIQVGSEEPMTRALHDLVSRRADDHHWPQLDVANELGAEARFIGHVPQFRDVIAAPHVAALIALGNVQRSSRTVLSCRQARMFDPEYFDQVFPHALLTRWGGRTYFKGSPG